MKTKVAAIVGPTAVGKTAVSLEVAEALAAEIISVDSMQLYRGMDIGTAKPDAGMRERVPHHLLDMKDPAEPVTVAEYQELARAAIDDITVRGRLPLLVGGSGLYLRAVVDDLDFPPRSPEIRRALEDEAESLGAEVLHARLIELDPVAASRIEPGNARRTVRALEVIELTGQRFSDNNAWDRYESRYDLAMAGLIRERPDLYERVVDRVDAMFEQGFAAEVEELARKDLGTTARQALGYKQILDRPGAPAEDAKEAIVRATKRFVRRQESWFRSDPRIEWFDAAGDGLAERLVAFFKQALALP